MFVVDRVEPDVVDQVLDVGDFDYGDSFVFEQLSKPGDKAVQISGMGQYVVGVNHIGL